MCPRGQGEKAFQESRSHQRQSGCPQRADQVGQDEGLVRARGETLRGQQVDQAGVVTPLKWVAGKGGEEKTSGGERWWPKCASYSPVLPLLR